MRPLQLSDGLTRLRYQRLQCCCGFCWVCFTERTQFEPAAFFAGVLRVDFGSYLQAFILSGILCLVAALLVLFVGGETKTSAQPSAA